MKKIAVLLFLLFICIGCDQSTKYTAKCYLEGRMTLSYMGDFLRLTYAENSGAFLSLGADLPANVRRAIFVIFTAVFLLLFLLFVLHNHTFDVPTTFACGLIIGGGLGNLIDRIVNQGAVIDFINVGIGPIRTGIFNVADLAITAGILIFMIFQLKEYNGQKPVLDSENEI